VFPYALRSPRGRLQEGVVNTVEVALDVTYTNRADAQAHIDRMDHPENFKIVVRLK